MKCLLIYYTGTYNTRYITNQLKERLTAQGYETTAYEIDPLHTEVLDLDAYDLVGLGYPIYGFNAPLPLLRFLKAQTFPKGLRTFIYKNSGETYHTNDASSISVLKKLKRDGAVIENEYHFIMPYNIHFRYEDALVKEMLEIDEMLLSILVYEVTHRIPNLNPYKWIHRIVTFFVKLQFIGGPVNAIFMKVEKESCTDCGRCIKNCPVQNIYKRRNGTIDFHHQCLMCMRCTINCPKDCVHFGLFDSWRVNGPYDFEKIKNIENTEPIITKDTTGFFSCYIETYEKVKNRYKELFSSGEETDKIYRA